MGILFSAHKTAYKIISTYFIVLLCTVLILRIIMMIIRAGRESGNGCGNSPTRNVTQHLLIDDALWQWCSIDYSDVWRRLWQLHARTIWRPTKVSHHRIINKISYESLPMRLYLFVKRKCQACTIIVLVLNILCVTPFVVLLCVNSKAVV